MIDNEYIIGATVMIAFLFMYTFIKVLHFTALKIYFCIVEGIILWLTIAYFMENEILDLAVLMVLLIVQGMLIYFIKVDYKKDLYQKEIYLKISSHFIPLLVIGISEVKINEIDGFIKILNELFRNSDEMGKKAFCFFRYEDDYIHFHGLFLSKTDMYKFLENKDFLELDAEEAGKGGSVNIKIKCDYH